MIDLLIGPAEALGILLLAPESRERTWDVIGGAFGPDVSFIDCALQAVFQHHAIDPDKIAVAGFSDGASYALSLGLTNGTLFSDILAFSPGFMAPARQNGGPRIFISHGIDDEVLPIDRCSRRLVPILRRSGYSVDYREFDGGHTIPPEMVSAAMAQFLR
jgi:phospholipase/carboxylesterase